MNNEQNNIQAKLEKWAEDTVKAYHQIATRDDVNIAFLPFHHIPLVLLSYIPLSFHLLYVAEYLTPHLFVLLFPLK